MSLLYKVRQTDVLNSTKKIKINMYVISVIEITVLIPHEMHQNYSYHLTSVIFHTLGDVFTFGSNQYGQLGAGDISVHHRIVRVRVPRAGGVAAGSNHTAVLTREGELYTFGSYQVCVDLNEWSFCYFFNVD